MATQWGWICIKLLEIYHSNRRGALSYRNIAIPDLITPYICKLDSKRLTIAPGREPYNAVDAITMLHDICNLDNETGKPECDRKMLAELNGLTPRGKR